MLQGRLKLKSCLTCAHLTDKVPAGLTGLDTCCSKAWRICAGYLAGEESPGYARPFEYNLWEPSLDGPLMAVEIYEETDLDERWAVDWSDEGTSPTTHGPGGEGIYPEEEGIYAEYDEDEGAFIMPEPKVDMREHPYEGLGPETDVIDHPSHYAEAGIPSGIECWDWYELAMTEEEFTGHMKGNVLKYTFRAGRKQNAIEDLEKARAYLKRWITYLNGDRTVHMRGKKR